MTHLHLKLGALSAVAALVAIGVSAPGLAQKPGKDSARLPDNWAYEIRNGKRVPKGQRVVGPDGSWKEEAKSNGCVIVREQTASGEYREVRKCD